MTVGLDHNNESTSLRGECHDIACDPVQEGATMGEAIPGSEPVVKPKVVVALLRVLRVNKMK